MFFAVAVLFTVSRHVAHERMATTTTSTTTATTVAPSTSTSTTTTTVVAACDASSFTGALGLSQGAAGTATTSVTLTNGGAACQLDGYPLITLQDKTGEVLPSTVIDKAVVTFPDAAANAPASAFVVPQGGTAQFDLAYSDVATGTQVCPTAYTLSVQLLVGGASVPVTSTYGVAPCQHGTLWVSPFFAR
jgi:hypothetical protein